MGQTVYVLMSLEGGKTREWRPVAVVTDPAVAEQWQQYSKKDVDWVPLELDDVRYLQPGEKQPEFHPHQMSPLEERAMEAAKSLQETNERLVTIIKQLQKKLGIKGTEPAQQPTASLLRKK